jgi:CheY-like chemotaxis protein
MHSSKIEKVLIVDDDPNIRMIAEMSLEGLTKWQLRLASSADEAMRFIDAELPDLILLDMMMPDIDGITMFNQLKEKLGAGLPAVIFMTAKVQTQEIEKYKSLGAVGVIRKPFDPMKLPAEIMAMVDSHVPKA